MEMKKYVYEILKDLSLFFFAFLKCLFIRNRCAAIAPPLRLIKRSCFLIFL